MDQGEGRTGSAKLFQNQIVLSILKNVGSFGGFFRFDPRQEVQTLPPVSAGGFVLSLAKLTMRLVERLKFHRIAKPWLWLYTGAEFTGST
jgi:hypothetical protein